MTLPIITSAKLLEVADLYPGAPDWKAAMLYAADEIDRLTAALAAGVVVRREDAKELECLAIAEATMEGLAASRNPRGQRLLAIAARIKAALAREECGK